MKAPGGDGHPLGRVGFGAERDCIVRGGVDDIPVKIVPRTWPFQDEIVPCVGNGRQGRIPVGPAGLLRRQRRPGQEHTSAQCSRLAPFVVPALAGILHESPESEKYRISSWSLDLLAHCLFVNRSALPMIYTGIPPLSRGRSTSSLRSHAPLKSMPEILLSRSMRLGGNPN